MKELHYIRDPQGGHQFVKPDIREDNRNYVCVSANKLWLQVINYKPQEQEKINISFVWVSSCLGVGSSGCNIPA